MQTDTCKGCGTTLADGGHVGWYCPAPECNYEYMQTIEIMRCMQERRERDELARLKAKYEGYNNES